MASPGFSDTEQRLCLVAGAVERPRPDPEGAAVRPDEQRRQPRRGREGAVLLPRRDADALVPEDALQVSAARVSVRGSRRGESPPRHRAEPEYELLDTGVFDEDRYFDVFVEYAKADADDVLMRITVHNRGPEAASLHVLPQLFFRNTWRGGMAARSRAWRSNMDTSRSSTIELGEYRWHVAGDGATLSVHRQRDEQPSPVRQPECRLRQGRVPRARRASTMSAR